MEIEVKVESENLRNGARTLTGTAFVTSVALDDNGRPTSVPKLLLQTEEDEKKFAEGLTRMEQRSKERHKEKAR
jgi:acyl-CoA hydrolase